MILLGETCFVLFFHFYWVLLVYNPFESPKISVYYHAFNPHTMKSSLLDRMGLKASSVFKIISCCCYAKQTHAHFSVFQWPGLTPSRYPYLSAKKIFCLLHTYNARIYSDPWPFQKTQSSVSGIWQLLWPLYQHNLLRKLGTLTYIIWNAFCSNEKQIKTFFHA